MQCSVTSSTCSIRIPRHDSAAWVRPACQPATCRLACCCRLMLCSSAAHHSIIIIIKLPNQAIASTPSLPIIVCNMETQHSRAHRHRPAAMAARLNTMRRCTCDVCFAYVVITELSIMPILLLSGQHCCRKGLQLECHLVAACNSHMLAQPAAPQLPWQVADGSRSPQQHLNNIRGDPNSRYSMSNPPGPRHAAAAAAAAGGDLECLRQQCRGMGHGSGHHCRIRANQGLLQSHFAEFAT
jgi:hypothetical protein